MSIAYFRSHPTMDVPKGHSFFSGGAQGDVSPHAPVNPNISNAGYFSDFVNKGYPTRYNGQPLSIYSGSDPTGAWTQQYNNRYS